MARYDRLKRLADSKPANVTAGSAGLEWADRSLGPPSLCQPFEAVIRQKLDERLSAQRIYQDLVADHGFEGSYSSVKRFVRRLGTPTPVPFRRMDCAPGQETQVDFGRGAWITEDGHQRRPHDLRVVLSHLPQGLQRSGPAAGYGEFHPGSGECLPRLGGRPQDADH